MNAGFASQWILGRDLKSPHCNSGICNGESVENGEKLHLDFVAYAEDVSDIRDSIVTDLADMEQPGGAVLKLQEGTIKLH